MSGCCYIEDRLWKANKGLRLVGRNTGFKAHVCRQTALVSQARRRGFRSVVLNRRRKVWKACSDRVEQCLRSRRTSLLCKRWQSGGGATVPVTQWNYPVWPCASLKGIIRCCKEAFPQRALPKGCMAGGLRWLKTLPPAVASSATAKVWETAPCTCNVGFELTCAYKPWWVKVDGLCGSVSETVWIKVRETKTEVFLKELCGVGHVFQVVVCGLHGIFFFHCVLKWCEKCCDGMLILSHTLRFYWKKAGLLFKERGWPVHCVCRSWY